MKHIILHDKKRIVIFEKDHLTLYTLNKEISDKTDREISKHHRGPVTCLIPNYSDYFDREETEIDYWTNFHRTISQIPIDELKAMLDQKISIAYEELSDYQIVSSHSTSTDHRPTYTLYFRGNKNQDDFFYISTLQEITKATIDQIRTHLSHYCSHQCTMVNTQSSTIFNLLAIPNQEQCLMMMDYNIVLLKLSRAQKKQCEQEIKQNQELRGQNSENRFQVSDFRNQRSKLRFQNIEIDHTPLPSPLKLKTQITSPSIYTEINYWATFHKHIAMMSTAEIKECYPESIIVPYREIRTYQLDPNTQKQGGTYGHLIVRARGSTINYSHPLQAESNKYQLLTEILRIQAVNGKRHCSVLGFRC